jgi:hypothetical protein
VSIIGIAAALTLWFVGFGQLANYFVQRVTYSTGSGFTTDMAPVELELFSEHAVLKLRVPKAYLADTRSWAGGKQERFVIEAVFPDIVPRPN